MVPGVPISGALASLEAPAVHTSASFAHCCAPGTQLNMCHVVGT